MKLFLAVTATLAMGALADKHLAEELEPKDGQTLCTKDVGGNEVEFLCEYYQTCNVAANKSFSSCLPKGNTACFKYKNLGTSGDIRSVVNPAGCKPYETCCDDKCCGADEQCMEVWGGLTDPFKYGDETIRNIDDVARNEWKTNKGVAIANKPRRCVPRACATDPRTGLPNPNCENAPIMDVSTGFKAVYMPLLGLGVTALIFIIAIVKRQDTFLEMLFPLMTIVTSFFLILSEGWIMALMCTFLAAATMASGDQDKKWLVWFQLFFMWIYFGGTSYFMFAGAPTNFFTAASSKQTIDDIAKHCSEHFDYYKLHPYQITWNMDPNNIYTGICGREFIGYQIFIAYGQAFALFLMVTTTVVGYLNPGEASSTTKNPAGLEMAA
jgi:hypothetical protein